MADDKNKLDILIDVRSRLDDLVKAQNELRKLNQEANSAGKSLKDGFGIDLARRGLDLLKDSLRENVFRAFELSDAIKDQSQNLGLSTDAYQVLGNVIKDAGGEAGQLTMMISQNNRSLAEARTYTSSAAASYRTLGLDIAKLEGMPMEQRFEAYGRAIAGSKDKTAAFGAASNILGSRNLPTVLGALRDLSTEGYPALEAAMKKAGRIMQENTIDRLEKAQKALEKFKQENTIGVAEAMAHLGEVKDAAKQDFFGTAFDFLRHGLNPMSVSGSANLGARLAAANPADAAARDKARADAAARRVEASKLLAITQAQTTAEYDLSVAMLRRETIESDPFSTNLGKKQKSLDAMAQELRLREKLIEAYRAMPSGGAGQETNEAHDLKIAKLEEENKRLAAEILRKDGQNNFVDKVIDTNDNFQSYKDDKQHDTGFGGGVNMGAKNFVSDLGTEAQQVAGAIQSSLGATVSGISDGIYGWVTGTQSFGQSMAQLGGSIFKTFLNTIIQMGVQWLVTQTLIKTSMLSTHALGETQRASRMAGAVTEGATTTAAMAPAAASASISSFGAAAVLGIVALLAAMALFGGFESGGYTGDGATNQVAGVVHGQEGVLNAPAMKKLGRGFLDRVNAGGDVASAASSSPAFNGNGGAGGGARESTRNIHQYIDREVFVAALQQDMAGIAHEVYLRNVRQGV